VLFTIIATSHLAAVHFRRVFLVIGAAAMVIGIHGIDMVETGIGWSGAKVIEGRITYLGFLNDPNDLALAFLVAIPMTLYWAHSNSSKIARLFGYTAVVAQLAGVYLANSRGSLVGLAIMGMVYAVRRFGIWRSLAMIPLLIGTVAALAPSRIAEISAEEESAAGRIDAWYEGFQMLLSHPLFGVGVGNFTDHNKLTAHNSLVLAFAELGMVGYFFWFALIIVSFEMIRRLLAIPLVDDNNKPRADAQTFHDLAATLGYALGGFMLSSMFLSRSYLFLLYVLQALVVALYLQARRQWPNELQQVTVRDMLGKLIAFELASLVFMYLLTRILL
jgi:putative inorganic carbon (hco3(-)) transporter